MPGLRFMRCLLTGEGIQELKTAIEQMLDTVTARDKDALRIPLIGPLRFPVLGQWTGNPA